MAVIKSLDELNSPTKRLAVRFLAAANRFLLPYGLRLVVTETYRTQARQNYLWMFGRVIPGRKRTWTRTSRHTKRDAVDVCFASAAVWKKNVHPYNGHDELWEAIGVIGEQCGLEWGGRWNTPDRPHFQAKD